MAFLVNLTPNGSTYGARSSLGTQTAGFSGQLSQKNTSSDFALFCTLR
jgi:hypothetical protein